MSNVLSLDELAAMSVDDLDALYRMGEAPATLAALDGSPPCRMLTSVGPPGRGVLASLIRGIARSDFFPWAGKTFRNGTEAQGSGGNRVRLGKVLEWFPFDTRIEASVVDGRPCVVLDYDKPANPWFIRAIHDELREVSPGLFLGPAMAKLPGGPSLVLFFAVDHSASQRTA